jgi:hypothetical protein
MDQLGVPELVIITFVTLFFFGSRALGAVFRVRKTTGWNEQLQVYQPVPIWPYGQEIQVDVADLFGLTGRAWINWKQAFFVALSLWLSFSGQFVLWQALTGNDAWPEAWPLLTSLFFPMALVSSSVLCFSSIQSKSAAIIAAGLLYSFATTVFHYTTMTDQSFLPESHWVRSAIYSALYLILMLAWLSLLVPKFRNLWLGIFVALSASFVLDSAISRFLFLGDLDVADAFTFSVESVLIDLRVSAIASVGLWFGRKYLH